jgi:beta-glucosidase
MWDVIHAAHLKAKEILLAGPGDYPVGLTVALMDIHSVPGGEENAKNYKRELSDAYLERLTEDDFVGVQTYSKMVVGPEGLVRPGDDEEINQMGEAFYPEALEGTIRDAAKTAGVPVIVTENGLAMDDDRRRVAYFQRALQGVVNCMQDGIDVRGYFCWSAMDNFEWVSGYVPKFGIIEVDRETMKRTPKPSAYMLGKIAASNRF